MFLNKFTEKISPSILVLLEAPVEKNIVQRKTSVKKIRNVKTVLFRENFFFFT